MTVNMLTGFVLLFFWTPQPMHGAGDWSSDSCYINPGGGVFRGGHIARIDVATPAACGAACVKKGRGCDSFSYTVMKECHLYKGLQFAAGLGSSSSYYGWCPGLGRSSGPSKLRGLKCGGKDVCQARGLGDVTGGGELSCVDEKGDTIPSSSCSDGDEAGTDFLRCSPDCFIPCEGGVAVSAEATETFRGKNYKGRTLTKQICRDLCNRECHC